MAKVKSHFECKECGHKSPKWLGSCPSCTQWNTFVEQVEMSPSEPVEHKARLKGLKPLEKPLKLSEISYDEGNRIRTGISELDRVLGGGFMPGSFVLLGGDPGIGKSTLTLQLASSRPDLTMLYCSAEESAAQIKQRAQRLNVRSENVLVYTETDLNEIVKQVMHIRPDILIIDSIQTIYRPELQSMPGNVAQIRECASMLMQLAKQHTITTLAIGHITKDGDLAGPRVLEHMVDAVLQFEGEKNHAYRLLRSQKNRFGSVNEIGVFEMGAHGLREVTNPSELFLSDQTAGISGNAVVCSLEGTRPLLLEAQALVSQTMYGTPQRVATGCDQRRLTLLLAVLEKRAGYVTSNKDVFVNMAGGMRVTEPAVDLGLLVAIASTLLDKPVLAKTVCIGEVGLAGEVRAVDHIESRVNEAAKMGFEHIVLPEANNFKPKNTHIKLIHVKNISDALVAVL